ncbi:hypothetical protein GCM10007140_19880 [Priestia taiwanensis]|uniref:Nudix hydrolase domain-containing protein n=2 Tax=Priestia taiwanensis TaxID=1347902 RepID=A0A917EP60_9BACI|nr:hypothetical protein GCM10007140_19880 [Priestia taiwanensis]
MYKRQTYEITPEMYEACTVFFHTYVLPNQFTQGATLVGRWVTADKTEITVIWEYTSHEVYERTEHPYAEEERSLYRSMKEEFLESTDNYAYPTHIVAVSGLIRNEQGEVLLVQVNNRSDTWETPGGQVERGETLEEALRREVKEETGVDIAVGEMIGVYQNMTMGLYSILFQATYVGGEIAIQPEEIKEAAFVPLTIDNIASYITRPHMRKRTEDALQGRNNVYEAFTLQPYKTVVGGERG